MGRNLVKYLVFCCLLGFYAFLYLATSRPKPCDDDCQKFGSISDSLQKNPSVVFAGKCNTSQFCIHVSESFQRDWTGLADTTCRLLQERGVPQLTVSIISYASGDTLLNRQCP